MPHKSVVARAAYQREYHRKWYQANGTLVRQRTRAANKDNVKRVRALLRRAKDGPCADCGQRFHFAAMQFDHVRGIKLFNLADMLTESIQRVVAEISKCELVCANCHAVRTWNRQQVMEQPDDQAPLQSSLFD